MWAISNILNRPRRWVSKGARRLAGDSRGVATTSFGLILPVLLAVSFGSLEFSLMVFDFHRAGEATRRAARMAVIQEPATDVSDFARGSVKTCSGGGGTGCSGPTFSAIVAAMQDILPSITSNNVEIEYRDSGLGDPTTPGGIIPVVTVRLVGLQQDFHLLGAIPGAPTSFTFPAMATSQTGSGLGPTGS